MEFVIQAKMFPLSKAEYLCLIHSHVSNNSREQRETGILLSSSCPYNETGVRQLDFRIL